LTTCVTSTIAIFGHSFIFLAFYLFLFSHSYSVDLCLLAGIRQHAVNFGAVDPSLVVARPVGGDEVVHVDGGEAVARHFGVAARDGLGVGDAPLLDELVLAGQQVAQGQADVLPADAGIVLDVICRKKNMSSIKLVTLRVSFCLVFHSLKLIEGVGEWLRIVFPVI